MPIQMQVLEVLNVRGAGGAAIKVDRAGNQFVGVVINPGDDAWIHVKKYNTAGQVVWSESFDPPNVTPPNQHKVDDCCLSASGNTLIVYGISHETQGTRPYYKVISYVPNIYVGGQGDGEEDGPGAAMLGNTPEVEVDYTRIQQIIQQEVRAEAQRIIDNQKEKVKAGEVELVNTARYDTDPLARAYQNAVYTRLDQILYEYFGQKPYPRPTEPQDGVQEQEKAT